MTALDQQVATARVYAELVAARPSRMYRPGRTHDLDGNPIDQRDNGQLQFHKSQHIYRILAPGNGYGKTTTAAVEIDWWGHGDHPYQQMPQRPRIILYVAQKYQQFEIQQPLLQKWWPQSVANSFNGQSKRYTWGDGTQLFVITAETQWETIQGVEPDLIVIDEECDASLWRELQRRRRGAVKTRYIVTATATRGLTWTYSDLYIPWRKWHEEHGVTNEREMMRVQGHRFNSSALADIPGIWCWPSGSHCDNPTATRESWALYQQMSSGSPVERQIRLYGGFRSMNATPVFDVEALELQRANILPGSKGIILQEE